MHRKQSPTKKPTGAQQQATGTNQSKQNSNSTRSNNQENLVQNSVETPQLGPQGKKVDKNAQIRAKAKAGQTHAVNEDPYSILEGNLPFHLQAEQLRDTYMVYKESFNRCQIRLRPKQIGEQFKNYYFQPKVPFLDEPEKQKIYRKNLINEVSRLPEPEPLFLMADKMHLEGLQAIGDRSDPSVMREDLSKFFMRRAAQLQHKKYKLLVRWSNSQIRSPDIDNVHRVIDHQLSLLQQEQDVINNRLERLLPDDKYTGAKEAERPSPTTKIQHQPSDANEANAMDQMNEKVRSAYKEEEAKLYIEKTDDRSVNSCIRQDDFEVFLRQKTYHNKLNRVANKLISQVKWVPFQKRYDMWKESREAIYAYRMNASRERSNLLHIVQRDIKEKIEKLGIEDEKAVLAVTERYTFHLKEDNFISRMDQILSSHRTDIRRPFMLFASNIELKNMICELALDYPDLSTKQLDIDNGQQFTYQMQTLFPVEFEKQVLACQFEQEDVGKDPDRQLLERLVKNLGLSRHQILTEISKYSSKQLQNSILGSLGYNSQLRKAEYDNIANANKVEENEQFSEDNLLRKIKTIEFFTLNELKLKLRSADWLEYVCFTPNISEAQILQNNSLSSNENPVDNLLKGAFDILDVQDQVSVNKILEDAATSHSKKITAIQQKIMQGELSSHKRISGKEADTTGVKASLKAATDPASLLQANAADNSNSELNKGQMKRYEHIQNIDQLNLSLVKNYYSLRVLKTREYKTKLLSVVNYFRAIQRILALDLKEHVTREKAIGERKDLLEPHFGRDGDGKPLSKQAPQTGPGKIFGINLHRQLDSLQHDIQHQDPVTINCFKFNGLFNPKSLSTCPMLPKHHRTFGRPDLYESVSAEIDRKTSLLHQKEEMECLLVKRDRIVVEESKQSVKVFNEFGQPIIYEEAVNDMLGLEEELIKIGSYYISQHEYLQANNDIQTQMSRADTQDQEANTRPSSMIDRAQIAFDLLKSELDFQFSKVKLIEKLLESYEHIYDPLESVRSLQTIVDTMALRPRLSMEASDYQDAYDSEIKVLEEKYLIFSSLIELQTDIEKEENKAQYDFQEMKVKKVTEAVTEKFKLMDLDKLQRIGSQEADKQQISAEEFAQEQKIRDKVQNQAKKDAYIEIQKKHITEYANEQYTNFSQVLGLPEISMEDLVNKADQKEPIIQDAIREQAFFTKQLEGYPTYFSGEQLPGSTLGLHCDKIGMLDFYESMSVVPKFNAALQQAFQSTIDTLKPENGLATSILELNLLKECRLKLLSVISEFHSGASEEPTKGQNLIEEDFFLANSDKLTFAMKQFKTEMDPNHLYKKADPLVVSKLDINSVKNYNFPRINMAEVREALESESNQTTGARQSEKEANAKIVKKMIELAKDSSARQIMEKRDKIEVDCSDDEDYVYKSTIDDKVVRSPSMMRMACNVLEVIRLREELIQRIQECNALSSIYKKQRQLANIEDEVSYKETINFNVSTILKEQINIVDSNHGKMKEFWIPFMEFDSNLNINLDLKNESCIKALMTELGVEELRGIVHYQIMQQQLLTVAVLNNQLLIDASCKGLKELELLDKGIVVPNPVLSINNIIQATTDGQNINAMKQERQRFKLAISSNPTLMYSIKTQKDRDREHIVKKFNKEMTRMLQAGTYSPELTLRILRSYRLKLMHRYCQNVLEQVQLDSVQVQSIQTCNELRQKAALMPQSEGRLFKLGKGAVLENISCYVESLLYDHTLSEKQTISVKDILNGQIVNHTLFYVPHTEEIILSNRVLSESTTRRQEEWFDEREDDILNIDAQIKQMVQSPAVLGETFQPGISHLKTETSERAEKEKRFSTQVLPQNRVMSQIQTMAGNTMKRGEESKLQMYKIEEGSRQKYGFRKVNFQKSNDYGHKDIFKLLQYCTLILRIYTLEYLMGRNNIPGRQILEMEQQVLTGREFWTKVERQQIEADINTLRYGDHSDQIKQKLLDNETAAEKVIERILDRKKSCMELREDMQLIKNRVQKVDQLAKDLPHERRTISHILDMLVLQHQATFFHFLNGLENILEIYRDKHSDEHFYKVMQVRDAAIRRNQGLVLNLRNGFYISQTTINPLSINLAANQQEEFNAFIQQYHPVVDERSLIPKQVSMMQRIYGICSDSDYSDHSLALNSYQSNYSNLLTSFYNLDDSSRSFIGTNFPQVDEIVNNYLIYKGIIVAPTPKKNADQLASPRSDNEQLNQSPERKKQHKGTNYTSELLLNTVEILSFKIEAAHMQRLLVSWIGGEGRIPDTTRGYTKIMRKYQDITTMKILQERDHLNDVFFSTSNRQSNDDSEKVEVKTPDSAKRDKSVVLNPAKRKTAKFSYFDKVNLIRAETNVIKRLLDQKLIQIATRMIQNEDSALQAAIDQAGSQELVQQFVHPQQQFASTMYQDVDKLGHLDIVNKLGFVQQFLTRLRNRCTEVDTLTSGPGIVFSMKDFNECISIFCKQALKYGEESLRQRTETSFIFQNQYRHLIYLKEMEIIYYRSKCEQFLRNIDVIVNTKMSAKGNQMIYELDITNRELRSLKDHYYLMERYMREELKKDFQKQISVRDNKLESLKANFLEYRQKLQHELQLKCATEITEIEEEGLKKKLLPGYEQKYQNTTSAYHENTLGGSKTTNSPENYETILKLERYIRHNKVLTSMKQVLAEERHQREIKEMELKLTLNSSLWEQLAESQKREQITRQELELTKRNLTHYEKLIERLYTQLEQLNNEKIRLQRYKSSKQKKISELEDKMKDLEILENIDLDKILTEMRLRDKKIERLEATGGNFNDVILGHQMKADNLARDMERKLAEERQAKNEAFAKLESMRIEMKALEGTDIKNDLWKDKCKELYEISKSLEVENDDLRSGLKKLNVEKTELEKVNDQFIRQQQSMAQNMNSMSNFNFTKLQNHPGSSMRNGANVSNNHGPKMRENMILNRKNMIKPLTAKRDGHTQKRAQSGIPGANRHGNRLYQRTMTNAQSYHYDKGQMVSDNQDMHLQQTLLSANTSYPAFSSDVDRQNQTIGGGTAGSTQGGHQLRSSVGNGTAQGTKMPALNHHVNGRKDSGFAQSSRAIGGVLAPGSGQGHIATQGHGVLSSNVIPASTTFSSTGKNSGYMIDGQGVQKNRLHTSQGARGVGSRQRTSNLLTRGQQNQLNSQMGVVGNTLQSANHGNYNQDFDSTTRQQIALQGGNNMVNIDQAEYAMQQEMKNLLQNSSAVANFTHGELPAGADKQQRQM